MRQFIYWCISFLFTAVNVLIPKKDSCLCIHSFPDYEDMTRAIIGGVKTHVPETRIVILTHNAASPPDWALGSNIGHYKKYSARGVWAYLRSKNIFYTHGCFSWARPVGTQNIVNVWHGMPIKKIGSYLDEHADLPLATHAISSSAFFKPIISFAFSLQSHQVLEVGLPRNDILVGKCSSSALTQVGLATENYCFWLPTYRQGTIGYQHLDGTKEANVFNLPDIDIQALNDAFLEQGITAIIKPHPMASKSLRTGNVIEMSHIKFISDEWLLNHNTSLYELLAGSSFLITDISSVLIDYLLTDRPIICHFPDQKSYVGSRGLTWNFNPEDFNIPVVSTQNELIGALSQSALQNPKLSAFKELAHSTHRDFTRSLLLQVGLINQEGLDNA